MSARIDHLVIAADSLEQAAAWCGATFGVQPSGGGKHPLMGTHNRVMAISSERFPDCYLEVIAIDPDAPAPGRLEWQGPHPSEHLAPTDLALQALVLRGVPPQAVDVLNLPSVDTGPIDNVHDAPLSATLESPRGRVVLDAWHTAG